MKAPLATPEEVAEYLQVKQGTLRVWAHRRKGPPYLVVEGSRRYDWADVHAWLNQRKVVHA